MMAYTDPVAAHVLSRFADPPARPQYSTLTDKILAANEHAEVNKALRQIKFGIDASGQVVLSDRIQLGSAIQGGKVVAQLNKALEEVKAKIIKDKETEMRGILGRSARR